MRRFCGSLQFSWGTVNHKGHEEPRRCFCDRLLPSSSLVTFYNYYFHKSFTTEDHRGRFLILISLFLRVLCGYSCFYFALLAAISIERRVYTVASCLRYSAEA